jgi:hypothetical protein
MKRRTFLSGLIASTTLLGVTLKSDGIDVANPEVTSYQEPFYEFFEKFNGFELWRECLAGNNEAWEEMMTYNIQDVHTLEEVYLKLRPWIKEHPNVAIQQEADVPLCSKCGSQNILMNGFTHTDISKFRLYPK